MTGDGSWRTPLRARAEKIFHRLEPRTLREQEDAKQLVRELELHQIELELMNEELQHVNQQLSLALERYRDLYHSAPVGYVQLDASGFVVEANASAAQLLGARRNALLGSVLMRYLHEDDAVAMELHRRDVLTGNGSARTLVRTMGGGVYLRIESERVEDGQIPWRAILTDVTDLIGDFRRRASVVVAGIELARRLVDSQHPAGDALEEAAEAAAFLRDRALHVEVSPTILVLESDPVQRGMCARLLAEEDFEVSVCATAAEALALTTPPDAALITLHPDDMNSFDLGRALRARFPGVSCIYVSGRPRDEAAKRALREPRTAWVEKPLDIDALARLIRAKLSG